VSILTLWARDGEAPMPIAFPVSVSDVKDEYSRVEDGTWRIRHLHVTPAFVGDEPPVLPFGAPDDTTDGAAGG
jgi:hypothetical protein